MSTSPEAHAAPAARPEEAPFDADELVEREGRVRASIAERDLDGLIITGPESLYYLTGYTTPAYYAPQMLVIARDVEPFLVVYGSEIENVRLGSRVQDVRTYGPGDDPAACLAQELRARGLDRARIGIETTAWFFTRELHDRTERELAADGLRPCNGVVEACRAIKSPAEVAYIREAAELASEAMRAVREMLEPGVSENEIAATIYATTLSGGAGFPGSPPYISSGPRVCRGHATWSTRAVEPGDQVYVELSASVARYSAALMRTFVVGDSCDALLEALEASIVTGLDAAIGALRSGVSSGEVDAACRESLASAGFEYPHETGYSIGIAYPPGWNETHVFNLKEADTRTVERNMALHLVPHVILPGIGTVGLSETVLVGDDSTTVLTDFPRCMQRV